MKLRDYQKNVHERCSSEKSGPRNNHQSATGSGKTFMAAAFVKHFTEKKGMKVLFLAHRREFIIKLTKR